jgi:glycosyltransferase involved in cell wall biosynthesis
MPIQSPRILARIRSQKISLAISIIIPNLNSGPLLERAIQSLIAQNYPNLQLILVDGVSTDESAQTIQRHRSLFDHVIIEKDKCIAEALNKGFALATGNILGWLCADDELLPGALHEVVRVFEADQNIDVVTGACQRVFPDGSPLLCPPHPEAWEIIGIQDQIEQSATFWKRDLQKKVGPLSTNYSLAFDWDFWNRFKLAGAHPATTEQVLSRYHFSTTNKTGTAGRTFANEAFQILRQYGPLGGGLAYIFRFLYKHFDVHGCYDRPPTCSLLRSHLFIWTLAALRGIIGKRLLYLYNWHFASKQERGLKWW